MKEMSILARAPSNIALIKYMGKKDMASNLPENASISMTLKALCTYAEVTRDPSAAERGMVSWVPELPQGSLLSTAQVPILKDEAVLRICKHMERVWHAALEILPHFGLQVSKDIEKGPRFSLRTANTFPASSGIASSASSFAAVTLGVAAACAESPEQFAKVWQDQVGIKRALARVSRMGSGSSCRSFEGPWVLWDGENASEFETKMPAMAHFVMLISTSPKKVSSSQAHTIAKTSSLWSGRMEKVGKRTEMMKKALQEADMRAVARLAWSETWEMHSLFHTATEPFTYWEPETLDALHDLAPMVKEDWAPIITMDAGPNIHVIVEASKRAEWRARLQKMLGEKKLLEDEQGPGAELLGEI